MSRTAADFRWLDPIGEDAARVSFSEPGTMLVDGDHYLDATSPRRGPVLAMEGEKVPVGGLYITQSSADDALWERLQLAASGRL